MDGRNIIGLNSAGFVTSAALLQNGEITFAVEEERLIREKRTRKFPIRGISSALNWANLDFDDIDAFATSWNPAINLEALDTASSGRARSLAEVLFNVPNNLMQLVGEHAGEYTTQTIRLKSGRELRIYFITHHLCHAASFLMSPFDEAAILSVDAFGEKHSALMLHGTGNEMNVLWSQEFPHSLGAFYATFTEFCGFKAQNDEWKLMGASPYGDPDRYYDKVRTLVTFRDDGGFELDLSCFNHYQFHRPGRVTPKLAEHLGLAPNPLGRELTQDYYDVCAAAQRVTEDVYFHLLNKLHDRTAVPAVVLAGGVALNSVANGKIREETPFEQVFIPSAPDDAGGAPGAALYLYNCILGNPRKYVLRSNYLGPGFDNDAIEQELKKYLVDYQVLSDAPKQAAQLIADGNIIGWFQGRLEFGDRALGNRSILADPRKSEMKDRVNATVKYREPFRPFAPSILAEHSEEYFVNVQPTPFMEKVFPIREEKQIEIPAVTHIDGSGRLQTVTEEQNPTYYALVRSFHDITGVPVVLNTSFNLKGEAIVCTPTDALRTFWSSGLDALIIGDYLVSKP